MKRFITNTTIALAGFLAIGLAGAGLASAEYRNVMTIDRYVAALGDQYAERAGKADPTEVMVEQIRRGEYDHSEYRNVMTIKRYVAAIDDHYFERLEKVNPVAAMIGKVTRGEHKDAEYKNVMTVESFITALEDGHRHVDVDATGLAKAEAVDPYNRL